MKSRTKKQPVIFIRDVIVTYLNKQEAVHTALGRETNVGIFIGRKLLKPGQIKKVEEKK